MISSIEILTTIAVSNSHYEIMQKQSLSVPLAQQSINETQLSLSVPLAQQSVNETHRIKI